MKKTIYEKTRFIESFVNSSLGKDGININIWCPFCKHPNKNKLKMSIHLENNIYHCWLCEKKGSNVPYLITKINPLKHEESKKFFSCKKSRIEYSDILSPLSTQDFYSDDPQNADEIIDFPEDFKLIANHFNSFDPDTRDIFKYAVKRGFNKHKIWMLKVGFSNNQDFKRSMIIPSLDSQGNINFYTSRRIDATTKDGFKYKNAQVQKKNIIFNEINIDWSLPLTLVEGPLDLVKTNDNATCLLGSSLTEDMKLFKKIVENKTKTYLALDSDVYNKSIYIADLLSSYDIEVYIIDTRIAEDVGDMTRNQFDSVYNNAKPYNKKSKLLSKIALI